MPVLAFAPWQIWVGSALIAVQSLGLAYRRKFPSVTLLGVVMIQWVFIALMPQRFNFPTLALLIAAYSVIVYSSRRRAQGTLAAVIVAELLVVWLRTSGPGAQPFTDLSSEISPLQAPMLSPQSVLISSFASVVFMYAIPISLGIYVKSRRVNAIQARERAEQLEREQATQASAAVRAERARMARELHDIAAHHLSGIVVQAGAAGRLLDRDPEAVRESLQWIRTEGSKTLENLRQIVGILRENESSELVPQPGLCDLPELIEQARATGTRITAQLAEPPIDLDQVVQITVYRALQESLSNARNHAPGAAIRVQVQYLDEVVSLQVDNSVPPAGALPRDRSGYGLTGMRERATMIGGTLTAGPQPDGGWRICLTVPQTRSASQVTNTTQPKGFEEHQ